MTKYKIESTDLTVTLYRRRFWYLWFTVESRTYVYERHKIEIMKKWMSTYGRENFIS